jgi:hypothetical protein
VIACFLGAVGIRAGINWLSTQFIPTVIEPAIETAGEIVEDPVAFIAPSRTPLPPPTHTPQPTIDQEASVEAAVSQALADIPTPNATHAAETVEAAITLTLAAAVTPTNTPIPTKTPLPTNTPTPTETPIPTPAPLFVDDFDLRPKEEWDEISGAWRITESLYKPDYSDKYVRSEAGDEGWKNYAVDVDIGAGNWFVTAVEIIARSQGGNYYAFKLFGKGLLEIRLIQDGDTHLVAKKGINGLRNGSSHHMRAEVQGDLLTLYVDDNKLQTQDDTLLNGRAGLGVNGGRSTSNIHGFDNFEVTQLE